MTAAGSDARKTRSLRSLGSVLRSSLLAVRYSDRIQRSTDYVITHARQIFHAPSANEHDGVLLQVVADAGNVGCYFNAVGQPDARDLAQSGVRLLGCLRIDTGANAAFLRAGLQGRTRRLIARVGSTGTNQLIECWHFLLL